jgi:hypothetical protein
MVQILPPLRLIPVRIFLQQLNVEAVKATSSLNIKGILPDLLNCRNPRQRQKKTKVVMKIEICAGDHLPIHQIFRLKADPIRGQNEPNCSIGNFLISLGFPQKCTAYFSSVVSFQVISKSCFKGNVSTQSMQR